MTKTTLMYRSAYELCEKISELDEPPIRRCPRCSSLCYEVPKGTYHCSRCGEFERADT